MPPVICGASVYNKKMLSVAAIAAVLGVNAVFSGAYLVGKLGLEHFPPFLFAALRFMLVALVLLPFLRFSPAVYKHWRAVLGFCLAMGIGVYSTMYWALFFAEGTAAVLIGTQFSTPAAVLMGAWLLGEKTPKIIWGGIAVVMAGVMIVGFDTVVLGYPLAFALILCSAACYAFANVISRGLRESGIGLLNMQALMSVFSIAPLLALSWLSGESWRVPVTDADVGQWATVLYSALVVTLVGHVGLFRLLRYYPLSAIMPFYVFTPIFGVLGAILLLGEALTWRFVVGAILAIAGIVVIDNARRRQRA